MKFSCEDGHRTECELRPRACTHTARGYVMRSSDALVVPPACGKPLQVQRCVPGHHRVSVKRLVCVVCGTSAEDIEKEPAAVGLKPWKDPECCQLGLSCCVEPEDMVDL